MKLEELRERNRLAVEHRVDEELSFQEKCEVYPFCGFIEVQIQGCEPFVMFSNDDDAVAKSYFFSGPDAFETKTMEVWAKLARRHRMIFDIGSFTGVYALAACAASPDCKVLGFEPSRNTYYRLITNIKANGFNGRVGALPYALGESESRAQVYHQAGVYCLGSGESLLAEKVDGIWYKDEVSVITGDSLPRLHIESPREFIIECLPIRVSLMKIDVEGYESAVLRGFADTIGKRHPTMIVECCDEEAFLAVWSILRDYEYDYLVVDDREGVLHKEVSRLDGDLRNVLFFANEEELMGL